MPEPLHFGALGITCAHVCVDMQRLFAEPTDWATPWMRRVLPQVVAALASANVNLKRVHLLGTGLWDDPRIFADKNMEGGLYAAPESRGFRSFCAR